MHLRRATKTDLRLVCGLDAICFPHDDPYPVQGALWWLVWDDDEPVAFAGLKWLPSQNMWYLCRVGVVKGARRQGLGKRLIKARLAHAKRIRAWADVVTYCSYENIPSANSLISCGFRLYTPEESFGQKNALYWMKTGTGICDRITPQETPR